MMNLDHKIEFLDLAWKHKEEITRYLHTVTYVSADRDAPPITWKWSDSYGFVRDPDYKIEGSEWNSAESIIERMREADHNFHFEWVDSGSGSVHVKFYETGHFNDERQLMDSELSADNGDVLSPMDLAIYSIFAVDHAKALMQEIFSDTGCDFVGE